MTQQLNHFYGFKAIKAKPMTRGEYNALRNWQVPANENPDDNGYLVEYQGSTVQVHPDFQNYISWSPADVFEQAYKENGKLGFSEAHAVALLEDGKRIARSGWNGADLSVYYVNPVGLIERHMVIHNGKTGRVNTWVPSSADLTAQDWQVI